MIWVRSIQDIVKVLKKYSVNITANTVHLNFTNVEVLKVLHIQDSC